MGGEKRVELIKNHTWFHAHNSSFGIKPDNGPEISRGVENDPVIEGLPIRAGTSTSGRQAQGLGARLIECADGNLDIVGSAWEYRCQGRHPIDRIVDRQNLSGSQSGINVACKTAGLERLDEALEASVFCGRAGVHSRSQLA